jgi:ABC-type branched-subunit amino acid transport system substrate-binding protein
MTLRALIVLFVTASIFLPAITSPHDALAQGKAPHRIGVILPLTGGWADWGKRLQQGLALIAEEHAAHATFEFHFEDEGTCDANKALTAYKFLRARHDIRVFLLGCMNGARAILPAAEREEVVLLSMGFEERDLFKAGGRLINLALQIDSEAEVLAQAIERQGVRRLALFRSAGTEDFITTMRREFARTAKVEIVFDESFQGDEPDLTSHISILRKRSVDGIFINLSEPALLKILRALKANRLSAALFSSYGIQGMASGNVDLRRDIEGLSFSFPPEGRGAAEYRGLFVKRFQSEPVINNYFVRDGISLLVDAAAVCHGLMDARCIRSFFQSGEWRAGMSGRFLIAKDGSITREFEVRRFEGGRPIFAMTATNSAISEEARAQHRMGIP